MEATSDGLFVVLEGIDGAGTTTQAEALVAVLHRHGHEAHLTAEPSTRPIGQVIRAYLRRVLDPPAQECMALLFAADRVHHLQHEIIPKLISGCHVICDRYVLSSLAYQGVNLPVEWIQGLNRYVRQPDLTILLRVGSVVAARRRNKRNGKVEIYDNNFVQHRVAAMYDRLIWKLPNDKVVIDANDSFDKVARKLQNCVLRTIDAQG